MYLWNYSVGGEANHDEWFCLIKIKINKLDDIDDGYYGGVSQIRTYFELPRVEKFEDINEELFRRHPDLADQLEKAYGNVDNVDLYIGGMLESKDGPGELFTAIIIDQFVRIREADRFWFENDKNE